MVRVNIVLLTKDTERKIPNPNKIGGLHKVYVGQELYDEGS